MSKTLTYRSNSDPEEVELYYNDKYKPSIIENFNQSVDMNPFIYKPEKSTPSPLRQLVIIWSANIKNDTDIDILRFQLQCDYIIHPEDKNDDSLNALKILLIKSCQTFSSYYENVNKEHAIKLKNIHLYYDNFNHHAEEIFPLLFDQ